MANPLSFIRAGTAAERAMYTIIRRTAQRSFSTFKASNAVVPAAASRCIRPVPAYGSSLRHGLAQRQAFSTSQARCATVVTLNPRQDEEGQDMTIEITDRAAKRLREIATKDKNPDLALRVRVESGGCHGFQYLMSLTNTKDFDANDDTVFETEDHKARVVMDEPSLELLKGSKVDFTMELIGSQFKISGNPAATSSCGCGTSFDIKAVWGEESFAASETPIATRETPDLVLLYNMSTLPKAFVFDVFGTLVNWRYSLTKGLVEAADNALQATSTPVAPNPATRRRASEMTWTHWEAFAVEWHGKYIAFATGFMPDISAWIGLDEIQLRSLKVLLEEKGLETLWSEQQQRGVASLWYQLDAWPDTANGIACLNSFGSVTSTLSNGSRQNLRELAERNSIPFTTILSSEDFQAYKPAPRVYKGGIKRLSDNAGTTLEPHEVAMVAAHLGDLKVAKACGMQTMYIERPIEEEYSKQEVEETRASGLIDIWIEDRPYEMGASGLRALVEVLSERYDQHGEELTR